MRSMKNLNLAISMAVAVLANATLADGHEIKFLDAAEGADGSNPIIKKVFTPDPAAVAPAAWSAGPAVYSHTTRS